nr:protein Brevis radix-like 2 [Ipomoea batatas]
MPFFFGVAMVFVILLSSEGRISVYELARSSLTLDLFANPKKTDAVTTPSTKQAIKASLLQIKDMAVKASGRARGGLITFVSLPQGGKRSQENPIQVCVIPSNSIPDDSTHNLTVGIMD